MNKLTQSWWRVFVVFFALTVLIRLPSFFVSVLDWDESLYLLMADALLKGHLPYTQIFDNKPPGIYLIFALGLKIFGHNIFGMRFLTVLVTSLSATLTARLARALFREDGVLALVPGLLFCVFSATSGGLAANTEHFFILFSLVGITLALKVSRDFSSKMAFLSGLAFGAAFQIKFFALFDVFAALLLVAPVLKARAWRPGFAALAGFLLPTLMVVALFAFSGHWAEYYYTNVTANLLRADQAPFDLMVLFRAVAFQVRDTLILWLGFFITVSALLNRDRKHVPRPLVFCAVWGVLDLAAVLVTRLYYPHYFLQVVAPFSIMAAYWLNFIWRKFFAARLSETVLTVAIVFFSAMSAAGPVMAGAQFFRHRVLQKDEFWGDQPGAIAQVLREKLGPTDWFLVTNYQPIVYFLCDRVAPTPYLFPPFLTGQSNLDKIAGIDGPAELEKLLSEHPRFVVVNWGSWPGRKEALNRMLGILLNDYERIAFVDGVAIFQKK